MAEIRQADTLPEPGDAASDGHDQEQLDPLSGAGCGYVRARFGAEEVLITPELADEVRTFRAERREQ